MPSVVLSPMATKRRNLRSVPCPVRRLVPRPSVVVGRRSTRSRLIVIIGVTAGRFSARAECGSAAGVGAVEVEVRARRCGTALALILGTGRGAAVRVLRRAGQPEKAQLADLHAWPEGDRQVRHVGQLEGDVAAEPGVDEARGGVGE